MTSPKNLVNRVLVLGDNDLGGLAIVRSLARAGLEVHLAGWFPTRIARASRYPKRYFDFGNPKKEPEVFVKCVLATVAETQYDMVLPVVDVAMEPLMKVAAELNRHTVFAAPEALGFEITHDKAKTVKLAAEVGLDVPASTVVTTRADIESLKIPSRFPVILKPTLGGLVRKARSAQDLKEFLAAMIDASPVLVQEFCPGNGIGLDILGDRGEIVAAFQHERVHEPASGGAGSYRRSLPLSQELLEGARRMCRAMQWTGPAMFEYKRDPRTGRAPLMEINGRYWGSVALSIFAGVDFPKLHYELLVKGRRPNVFTYKIPFYARNTRRDIFWLQRNIRTPKNNPELMRVPVPSVLKETLNILSGRERWDAESFTDPLPGFVNWVEIIADYSERVQERVNTFRFGRVARAAVARLRANDPAVMDRLRHAPRVMFLCAGNINRSAFAGELAKAKLGGASGAVITSVGFLDRPSRPCPRLAVMTAANFGIDLSPHRSTVLTRPLLDEADLIFAVDLLGLEALHRLDPESLKRTVLLGALDTAGNGEIIDDPAEKGPAFYNKVFGQIARCVENWSALRGGPSKGGDAPGRGQAAETPRQRVSATAVPPGVR